MRLMLGLGFLGAALLLGAAGVSANGMRCENKLVQTGDSTYDVKSLCGPPADVQQRTERRRVRHAVERRCPAGPCTVVVDEEVDIVIELWTYDFGPQRFLQYLTFEQGKLVHVKSGGYGHKKG